MSNGLDELPTMACSTRAWRDALLRLKTMWNTRHTRKMIAYLQHNISTSTSHTRRHQPKQQRQLEVHLHTTSQKHLPKTATRNTQDGNQFPIQQASTHQLHSKTPAETRRELEATGAVRSILNSFPLRCTWEGFLFFYSTTTSAGA